MAGTSILEIRLRRIPAGEQRAGTLYRRIPKMRIVHFLLPGVFLLIGLAGVSTVVLAVLTAVAYSTFLVCRLAPAATVVVTHHLPFVGYFLLGTFALCAFNFTTWLVYWAMATHGLREFLSEFHNQVIHRARITWHRCRPCAWTTGRIRGCYVAWCFSLWTWLGA